MTIPSSMMVRACVLACAALGVLAGAAQGAQAKSSTLQITTNPGLFPAFSESITDYVVRCQQGTATQVQVKVPPGASVSVDGGPARKGDFSVPVGINPNQAFRVVETQPGKVTKTFNVRCLPTDFPTWTVSRPGTPQAAFYMMAPTFRTGGFSPDGHYVVIFDNRGVPLWWYSDPNGMPGDMKLLPNGDLMWTTLGATIGTGGQTAQEHLLDGSIVRLIDAAPTIYGVGIDFHDIQLLPNGDYLILGGYPRQVDMTPIGGPANGTIYDDVVQEVNPDGWLMWQWDTYDHIGLDEVDPQWRTQILGNQNPYYDPYHINSVEQTGDNVVISYRHLDAIYDVSRTTNQVVWKLGGTPRDPALPGVQLQIQNDPVFACGSHFGGQHDARTLPDGTIALHDNGSGLKTCGTTTARPPRGVRYSINLGAGTATLLEQVSDPTAAPASGCCGSAVRLGAGATDDWVADWGLTPITDELTPAGTLVFRLSWSGRFSYRTYPILPGALSAQALRDGMNAQFPR